MRVGRAAAVLLITASACSGATPVSAQTVEVEISHSRFVPDHFSFPAGTVVTFVVANNDPIDHEFLIGDERAQETHEEGTEAHHGATPGEISIPAGETRSTTYEFSEPGRLLIGCHLPSHYGYGMKGSIDIEG